MKTRMFAALALLAGVGALALPARADELVTRGVAWIDYSAFLAHDDDDVSGINGFQLRRLRATFDRKLGDGFDSRLRLEMDQQALQVTDGGSGDSEMVPFVKDAWLRWKYTDGHQAQFGLFETPFLRLSQSLWGLRRMEKTVADLERMASTRDIGVGLKGGLGGSIGYHAMVANGNGDNEEINPGKSLILALHQDDEDQPLVVEVAGKLDFQGDLEPGDWLTVKGVLGYRGERGRAAVEVAHQVREDAGTGGDDFTLTVASAYGVLRIDERSSAFARVDQAFDADTVTSTSYFLPIMPGFEHTVVMGGVDIELSERVTLSPNVQAVLYGDDTAGNPGPDPTIIGRVTMDVSF